MPFNRTVLGDPETVKRLHFMAPLDDQKRQHFLEIWEEVKTQLAQ